MTKARIEELATKCLNEKVEKAQEAMGRMTNLAQIWAECKQRGFDEGAKALKNTIFLYLMIIPQASELDVIYMLADKLGINIEDLKK